MNTTIRTLLTIAVLVVAASLVTGCMPYRTDSTEVGVRTVKWSLLGNKGVQPEIYQPGATQFLVPFLNDWHTFDTRLQNLEMTHIVGRGDRHGDDELLFKTIDGNDIGLDVIISYKIIPDKAPLILQDVATNDRELKESIVRTVARSKPRDIFGELNTEEFYNSSERTAKADEVKEALNEILEPYGVIVERVGTRDYSFNEEYQKAIEDKKVADQEAEKLKSETEATKEEYLVQVEKAKAEVEKVRAEADGEYKRAVIEADAYYEQQIKLAEAIIAEGQAKAEGIRKMNEALSGMGGEAMVKLEVAKALAGKRIIMLPMGGGLDLRTTDINHLLELYGVKSLASPAPRPAAKTKK